MISITNLTLTNTIILFILTYQIQKANNYRTKLYITTIKNVVRKFVLKKDCWQIVVISYNSKFISENNHLTRFVKHIKTLTFEMFLINYKSLIALSFFDKVDLNLKL